MGEGPTRLASRPGLLALPAPVPSRACRKTGRTALVTGRRESPRRGRLNRSPVRSALPARKRRGTGNKNHRAREAGDSAAFVQPKMLIYGRVPRSSLFGLAVRFNRAKGLHASVLNLFSPTAKPNRTANSP